MFNKTFQKVYRRIILEEFNPILKQEFKELPHQFLDDQIQTDIGPIQNIISGKYGVVIAKTKDVIKKLKEQNDIFMLNQFKKYYKYGDISENFVYNAALIDIKTNRILAYLDWETLGAISSHLQDQGIPTQITALDGLVALAKGLTISSNLIQTFIKVSVDWAMGGGQGEFYDRFKNNEKQLLKKRKNKNWKKFNNLHDNIYKVRNIQVNDDINNKFHNIFINTGNPIFQSGDIEAFRIGSDNISEYFLNQLNNAIMAYDKISIHTKSGYGLHRGPGHYVAFMPQMINQLKEALGTNLKNSIVFFVKKSGEDKLLGFIDFVGGVVYLGTDQSIKEKCSITDAPNYIKEFLKENATTRNYYFPRFFTECNYHTYGWRPVGYLWSFYTELFNKDNKSRFEGYAPSAESKNYLVYNVYLSDVYLLLNREENKKHLSDHNYRPNIKMKLLVNKSTYDVEYVCYDSGKSASPNLEDQEALNLLGIEQQEE